MFARLAFGFFQTFLKFGKFAVLQFRRAREVVRPFRFFDFKVHFIDFGFGFLHADNLFLFVFKLGFHLVELRIKFRKFLFDARLALHRQFVAFFF